MSKLDELAATPKPTKSWRPTDEERRSILAAHEHGWSWEEIAKALSADRGERISRERLCRQFRDAADG